MKADLPERNRPSCKGAEKREGVVAHCNPEAEVHGKAGCRADHGAPLQNAVGARELQIEELHRKRGGENGN